VIQNLEWENQIGRRIRLRDLQIFLAVTQRGSMARAAADMGVSRPAVSGVIADLERTLGVPLFERSTRGVKPTMYARAMIDRSVAAFDELKQGIRTLENLADPTAGELWVGCIESIAASTLPPILKRFMQQYPRVVIHIGRLASPTLEFRDLCERNFDLVLARNVKHSPNDTNELNVEPLFDDRLIVAAGARSRWARRSKVDLADLIDEPWVLTPADCWTNMVLMEAFRAQGLEPPKIRLTTYSVPLRMDLVATGPYITIFSESIQAVRANRSSIKILPIELPASPWPLAIVTLRHRILNPVAERFIAHVRDYATSRSSTHTG
jgi:DNA-binding transcriptional LysR family regulator